LAVLAPAQTILLEEFAGCSLAKLLRWNAQPAGKVRRQRLIEILRHAGAWLREYHSLPPLQHTRARGTTRLEFVESLRRTCGYLSDAVGRSELLEDAINGGALVAKTELPQNLPLALSHSDFAPRNVLVGTGNQVAAIDTLGRWMAPIYEDLGHFLVAMRTGSWYSSGLWSGDPPREMETAFIQGYFASTAPPWAAVRLFELQSLLYHWVAIAQGADNARGLRRLVKRCRLAVINPFLAHHLASLTRQLNS
jgi:aminoglycoside phosphotransferase (APT) family kinase protein